MPRIIAVRHGETDANTEGRYQGQNQTPLNETGRQQAQLLAGRLSGEGIRAILCSDLARAWQTAEPVANRLGLPVEPEPLLREIDVGRWEGLNYQEIQERFPDLAQEWDLHSVHAPMPGGESADDLARRVSDLLDRLRTLSDDHTVLLVTHGGWIQALLCLSLGVDLQRRYQFRVHNASVSAISYYGQFAMLELFNDCHHLGGAPEREPERAD